MAGIITWLYRYTIPSFSLSWFFFSPHTFWEIYLFLPWRQPHLSFTVRHAHAHNTHTKLTEESSGNDLTTLLWLVATLCLISHRAAPAASVAVAAETICIDPTRDKFPTKNPLPLCLLPVLSPFLGNGILA